MKSEGKSPQRRKDDDRSFHLARRVSLLWSAYFSVGGLVNPPPSSLSLWGRSHAPSYRQSCTSEYTTRVRRPSFFLTRTNNHINRDNWRSHRVPGTERDLWDQQRGRMQHFTEQTLMNHRLLYNRHGQLRGPSRKVDAKFSQPRVSILADIHLWHEKFFGTLSQNGKESEVYLKGRKKVIYSAYLSGKRI